ncbi:penicillin-binding protein [Nocardioides sp. MJB4]|uniref:Beta-lactamase n=2 Tax=Nocardioides donggukensis TaxID=2774019 RepID=A0A927K2W5_9ACTN|nr:penicillin-binding protein [Nocardioides donggukensis]
MLFSAAACTSSDDGADDVSDEGAAALAGELASALTARQVEGVPGADQEALERILPDLAATVTAGGVETEDDTATATLSWEWETPGEAWRYDTQAELTREGETWRVVWDASLVEPSLTADERLRVDTLDARRGDIVGAGDRPIVTDRSVVRFGIDRTRVRPARAVASARALAALLDVAAAPYAARVEKAGEKAFVEAIVLRADDARQVDGARLRRIKGAVGIGTEMPLAPTREFAAPLLGRVGPATAEIVEESDGAVEAGDVVGLSGLQARYEERLAGQDGIRVQAAGGTEDRVLFTADEQNGEPLRTTLDVRLQTQAEQALSATGPASALVALRPSTGDIVAAASGPGSGGLNTATFGQYAPGSTFKVVSALALLRAGVGPGDPVPCTPSVTVDGKRFTNYDDYPASALGRIPLRSAVANSCNTALISQSDRLTGKDLAAAAAALGVGVDHDVGFPAFFGTVPAPGSETGKAAALIGQGTVQASPLAMAAVAASVVEGRAVLPRLLPDVDVERVDPSQPLTGAEAGALRAMMRAVVTEGSASFLADVPGAPVGAKTGTAEYGTGTPLPTHTWLIAHQGDLAVAVFVETGRSGSQTSGPILERFLRAAR